MVQSSCIFAKYSSIKILQNTCIIYQAMFCSHQLCNSWPLRHRITWLYLATDLLQRLNPECQNFSDFSRWAKRHLLPGKNKTALLTFHFWLAGSLFWFWQHRLVSQRLQQQDLNNHCRKKDIQSTLKTNNGVHI